MSKLYNDVLTHDIYKILTADLDEKQHAALDNVMKEFTARLEAGLLFPLGNMVSHAYDKTYEDAMDAAIKDGTATRESTGRPDPAPEQPTAEQAPKPEAPGVDEEEVSNE